VHNLNGISSNKTPQKIRFMSIFFFLLYENSFYDAYNTRFPLSKIKFKLSGATAAVHYLPGKLPLEGVSGDLLLERETESERIVLIEKGFNWF